MNRTITAIISLLFIVFNLSENVSADSANSVYRANNLNSRLNNSWDPIELESFFDQNISDLMQSNHIPGVALVFVKDGQMVLSKGYGYADLIKDIQVKPAQTVFKVADVSSVFTATALLQLVEENKINLDDDVNHVLAGIKIPATYEDPITVGSLLTHTAGFDNQLFGIAAKSADKQLPLKEYVTQYLPPRVRMPGISFSYSIFGYTLAGYLVEAVSGMPFIQYMENQLLQPMQMEHSGFTARSDILQNLAVGYTNYDYYFKPTKPDFFNAVPSLGLYSTAEDIAHFIIVQLNEGKYNDNQVLQPETIELMHREAFSNYPGFSGMTNGFFEYELNNKLALGLTGSWNGYSSGILIFPEDNLGMVILSNSDENGLPNEIGRRFVEHYFPSDYVKPSPIPGSSQTHNDRLAGLYRLSTYSHSTLEKTNILFGRSPDVVVTVNADGSLSIDGQGKWVETDDLVFSPDNKGSYDIFFQEDGTEKIIAMLTNQENKVWDRLAWFDTRSIQIGTLAFSLIIFLSVLIILPARRLTQNKSEQPDIVNRTAQLSILLMGALAVFGLVGMIGVIVSNLAQPIQFAYNLPVSLQIFLVFLHPVPVISLSLVAFAVSAWLNRYWSLYFRVYFTFVVITGLIFTWFLLYWNFLGFRF